MTATAGRIALASVLLAGAVLATVDLLTFGLYAPYAAVGGYLVGRRPRNAIGWVLIGIGFTQIGTTTPPGIDVEALEAGAGSFRDLAYMWVAAWAGGASFLCYAALALIFPSGHLPDGRWRWPTAIGLVAGVFVVAIPAFLMHLRVSLDFESETFVPNPLGVLPDPPPDAVQAVQVIVTAIPLAILAGSVVGLLVRYRRAQRIAVLQIRWFLAALSFLVVAVIVGLVGFIATDMTTGVVWIPALLAYPSVALAVGFAVTRYRLFEIDRIISRTISWAIVSGALVAVFAGGAVALQAVLSQVTQGQTLAVAMSTLVAFALVQPVRRRVQGAVDRRFDRARYDAERTATAFADRLRSEVDIDVVLADLRTTVRASLAPGSDAVWLRRG